MNDTCGLSSLSTPITRSARSGLLRESVAAWTTRPCLPKESRSDCNEPTTGLGIEEVPTAPKSPWQNPYAERVIGSIRRECLDHVIVLGESHLRRIVRRYADYYNGARTHLSLDKDSPDERAVQSPNMGTVIGLKHVGGLHHQYVRMAA